MPEQPDLAGDVEDLFNRTLDHLHQVNHDPAATWLDQERALAAAVDAAVLAGTAKAAVLAGIANTQPPPPNQPANPEEVDDRA